MRWNILPNGQTTCKALWEGRGSLNLYKVEDIPWIWRIIQRHPEESKTAVAKAVKDAANILKIERYRRSFFNMNIRVNNRSVKGDRRIEFH